MAFGINKLKSRFSYIVKYLYEKQFGSYSILNLNRNLLDKNQKKILLCYTIREFQMNVSNNISHANILHSLQMVKILINHGYAIDVLKTNDLLSVNKLQDDYDLILGFGPVFEKIISDFNKGKKILFLTENDPRNVAIKYKEREDYFRLRHGSRLLKYSLKRDNFYTEKQIVNADIVIAMNSDYNLNLIKESGIPIYKINSNGIKNVNYIYDNSRVFMNRNNFVWFGSAGLIHKGLDILIDTFKLLPDKTLSIYGVDLRELPIINRRIPLNVHLCGRVDVYSQEYINEVLLKNTFIIFPSCSEGMSTAVATSMMHGLIPIITPECGFDNQEYFIEINDYHIESIIQTIKSLEIKTEKELKIMSEKVYHYSQKKFSLSYFTESFDRILTDIESK